MKFQAERTMAAVRFVRSAWHVALAATAVLWAAGPAAAFAHADVARRSLEEHIIPSYQDFASRTQSLADATRSFCDARSEAGLAKARSAFKGAVIAWGRIGHIRFGPAVTDNRYDRILFWPDPRHVTMKQVGRLLRTKPEAALKPENVATASVATVGLRALEIVFFGPGSDDFASADKDKTHYRCGLALALSEDLHHTAAVIFEDWTSSDRFQQLWLHPGADNSRYLKPSETTQALVQSFADRLNRMLAFDIPSEDGEASNGNGTMPIFGPSGVAIDFLSASLDGLEALLKEGGFLDQSASGSAEDTEDVQQRLNVVLTELRFARRALGLIAQSEARGDFKTIPVAMWKSVRLPVENAREIADETLKAEAGLSSGFNALDGD